MNQRTVTINGTEYDAHTGMPIRKNTPLHGINPAPQTPKPEEHHSHSVHQVIQKSQTLNRQAVKRAQVAAPVQPRVMQKSPAITKFAPHPTSAKPRARSMDIGPVSHPMVTKAHQQMQQAKPVVSSHAPAQAARPMPKPSNVIKQEAVAEALQKAPSHSATHKQVKQPKKRSSRFLSLASASLALLLLGGYFTYINMPSLSVRVAAAQAGVNATYPEYRPDGYSLRGPVAYTDGEVLMKFAANGGPQAFSISQTKTNWDSAALEENYVAKESNGGYIDPYIERGLKIYIYDNNAAWINGGVLYKLTGDAPLSNDQIRRIATSM